MEANQSVLPGHYILSAAALPNEVGECDPAIGKVEAGGAMEGVMSMEGTSMVCLFVDLHYIHIS